jgi:hypothetical protein
MNLDDLLEELKDDNGQNSPDNRGETFMFKDSMWESISFMKDNTELKKTLIEVNENLNLRDSWDLNSLGIKLAGNNIHIPDHHNPNFK